MNFFEEAEDYQPVFRIGAYPVYVTQLLVGIHLLTVVIMALAMAAGNGMVMVRNLYFFTEYFWRGSVWQAFTYPFFEPPQLWLLWNMAMLWIFGTGVERMMGRRKFLGMYATLILVPILLLAIVGFFTATSSTPTMNMGGGFRMPFGSYYGAFALELGVFAAFALLYPSAEFFFNFSARVIFWAIFAMRTLVDIASQDFSSILMTWTACGCAWFYVKAVGFRGGLTWLEDLQDKWRARKLARQAKARHIRVVEEQKVTASMDAVLEKISREGIGSLTPDERAALEKARAELIKKEHGKR